MTSRLILLILSIAPLVGYGTHIRGGDIRVVSVKGLTVSIELTVLTNTGSQIKFGDGTVDFGDESTSITPTMENTNRPDLGVDIGIVVYTIEHTYEAPGFYRITYMEPNLAGGILNMFNSVETKFFIETVFELSPSHSIVSPTFPTVPIFRGAMANPYSFSTAAIDDESDEVFYRYSLIRNPKGVEEYQIPNSLAINMANGMVTWDTRFRGQFIQGEYWFVVRVDQFSDDGSFKGYVQRAFQIILEETVAQAKLSSSVTDPNNKVVVAEGEEQEIKTFIYKSDYKYSDEITFDVYFNERLLNNISVSQYDSINSERRIGRVAIVKLKTTPDILSDLPYPVTIRAKTMYPLDITFLFMTRDVPLPSAVVTGLQETLPLQVYPNPFSSELYIDGLMDGEVVFMNSLGEVVARMNLYPGQAMNTSSFAPGIYLVQVIKDACTSRVLKLVRD